MGHRNHVDEFRPSASEFTIRVALDMKPRQRSVRFSLTVVLRPIRLHMEWVNGSIADTAVSTGARSFEWGTSWHAGCRSPDGVSGVKGYVYEPTTAVGLPSTFLPTYASVTTCRKPWQTSTRLGMGVVVGDPKMAPYTTILHDVNLVAARSVGNVNLGEPTTRVLVENSGMSGSNGTLRSAPCSVPFDGQSLVASSGR